MGADLPRSYRHPERFSLHDYGWCLGAFISKTSDDAQKVVDHFKQLFQEQAYKIGSESMTKTGGGAFGAITGELSEQGRSINVIIIESSGESQVTINYNEKKQ